MNILSSSSNKSINNEDLLKLRFRLEDNVKAFFEILSVSEIREIELATAILLDAINDTSDSLKQSNFMFKVMLLRGYHTLRKDGNRQLKKLNRWFNYTPPLTNNITASKIVPDELRIDSLPKEEEAIDIAKSLSS